MSMSLARIAIPSSTIFAPFVDERVDEPLDDLLVADLARRDAEARRGASRSCR
jgi:hypothetical protein